jgi:hypothetical protein
MFSTNLVLPAPMAIMSLPILPWLVLMSVMSFLVPGWHLLLLGQHSSYLIIPLLFLMTGLFSAPVVTIITAKLASSLFEIWIY